MMLLLHLWCTGEAHLSKVCSGSDPLSPPAHTQNGNGGTVKLTLNLDPETIL